VDCPLALERAAGIGVAISPEALDVVTRRARAEAPRECCGVLLGKGTVVDEAIPTANLSPDPARYLIDPQDHVDALRVARARGLEVVGFFHSHPHSDAQASPADVAEITYPGSLFLIVGLGTVPPDVRVFRATTSSLEPVTRIRFETRDGTTARAADCR